MLRSSDPLRPRSYLHFDERTPRSSLEALVTDPKTVASWQFLPLISLIVRKRKIRTKDKANRTFEIKTKDRPICYASHRDAALYAHYAAELSGRYENVLKEKGLSECITAFRPSTGRCNIHFALDAFRWIEKKRPCVALAFDISGFFDTLDHTILKRKWCEVLGIGSLPADSFSIFRSLTKFVTVDRDVVYSVFGISKNNPRAGGRLRICSAEDFRTKVVGAGFLAINGKSFGIPQGTPISAVLSNLYLLDFDEAVASQISEWGGLYRRYCDDILCVVPPEHEELARKLVEAEILKVKLNLQPDKVGRFEFRGDVKASPPLQYLGLTFDGEKVLLRSGGIGRYYARMRAGVRLAGDSRDRVAREMGMLPVDVPIKIGKLISRYGYAGERNFISYAHRASKISGDKGIKGQVSRHWPALKQAVKRRSEKAED